MPDCVSVCECVWGRLRELPLTRSAGDKRFHNSRQLFITSRVGTGAQRTRIHQQWRLKNETRHCIIYGNDSDYDSDSVSVASSLELCQKLMHVINNVVLESCGCSWKQVALSTLSHRCHQGPTPAQTATPTPTSTPTWC